MRRSCAEWRCLFEVLALACLVVPDRAAGEEGVRATIHGGGIAIVLNLDDKPAPRAVRQFAGLAEGARPWLDRVHGIVRQEPFYDGLKLHAEAGLLTLADGERAADPGYRIPDDVLEPPLKPAPYMAALVAEGPNQCGSRLLIAGGAIPSDFRGWIQPLGTVAEESREAVDAVLAGPGWEMDIDRIEISVGVDAGLPDVPLPELRQPQPGLRLAPGRGVDVSFPGSGVPGLVYVFRSGNLISWKERGSFLPDGGSSGDGWFTLDAEPGQSGFFRFPVVDDPEAAGVAHFRSRTLTTVSPGGGTLVYQFDETGTAGVWRVVEIELTGPLQLLSDPAPVLHPRAFAISLRAEGAGGAPVHRVNGGWDSRAGGKVAGRHVTDFLSATGDLVFSDRGSLTLEPVP